MADKHNHQTRRQKRSAAAAAATAKDRDEIDHGADFILAQPDRSGPKGKSLLDIAAERQAQLAGIDISTMQAEHVSFPPSSSSSAYPAYSARPVGSRAAAASFAGNDIPAWATAALYAVSLTMAHLTLDVAVHHQYAQELEWPPIAARGALVLPLFAVLVLLLHLPSIKARRWARPRQCLFFVFAVAAGAHLVRVGNTRTYIAVMRRAPPLGALLIWSFVEMDLSFSVVALVAIGAYAWRNGYSVT